MRLASVRGFKAKALSHRRKLSDESADNLWASEVASWVNSKVEYQKGCMPISLPAGSPYATAPKGLAIVLHTFSSVSVAMIYL